MAYKDYYSILGVDKKASQDDVNSAYRKLARKFHPDISKEANAEQRFKEIGAAYEVLRDPEKRELYDRYGEQWKAVSEGRAPPPGAGPEQVRVDFQSHGFDPGQFGDLGSVFEQFFGQQRGSGGSWRHWSAHAGGIDVEARLDLGVEEAFRGGERSITLHDPDTARAKNYNVRIPAGVRQGQRIRMAGQGHPSHAGGPHGDLYLVVALHPTDRFELRGSEVHTVLPVSPWEAALGATVKLPTLEGAVNVKVPAGSSSGREIRLPGKGYPDARGQRGDLFAEIRVRVPSKLSDQERQLFEQLAKISNFRARPET